MQRGRTNESGGRAGRARRGLGRGARALAALAVLVATAPEARAQWERLDRSAPHVVELVAATNLIVERWPEAARHYELLMKNEPEHRWAPWLATHSLVQLGELERALEVGTAAMEIPQVRAPVALELARCGARLGDRPLAVEFLEAALDAQLVMPARTLREDGDLKALRDEPALRKLIGNVEDVPGRFAALADADDHEGLVRLWHANAAMSWADLPSTLLFLKDVVDDHGRALDKRRAEEAAQLALRLERGARAADEAHGCDLYRPWIGRALAWSDEQRKQDAGLWKKYQGLGSGIRSHRFASVLETLDELDAVARRLGDLPAHYGIDRTRGLVHSGILNYKQPRKGISREQESEAGRATFRRCLDVAQQLEDVHGRVDSYDFLATFEVQHPRLPLAEAEQLVFAGMIASARVEPTEREFGMFEAIWRDLQAVER